VNPTLLAAAGVVVLGGVVCVGVREARLALAGLAVTLIVAPFIADPLPDGLALSARLVGAVLAAYLPWIVVRDPESETRGTVLGWAVDALLAGAALVIGYGAAGLGAPAAGPAEAQGAGLALIVLSIAPLAFGRDVFRLGNGAVLLVTGALLIRVGLAGTPTALEELVTAVLVVGICGAVAFLSAGALASCVDEGLDLAADAPDEEAEAPARRATAGVGPQPSQG